MKAIRIKGTDFIIRESGHMVDRNSNDFQMSLSLEPMYGVALTRDIQQKAAVSTWYFSEKEHPALWSLYKETRNSETMNGVAGLMDQYFSIKLAKRERNQNPVIREVLHETVDGKTISYYRDEDEAAFLDAVERTSMEPQKVVETNPHEEALREFMDKGSAFNQIEVFLAHIEDQFGSDVKMELIEI